MPYEQINVYQFHPGHRTKWTLCLYRAYPTDPIHKGPYCIQRLPVKARHRKAYETQLREKGAISMDALHTQHGHNWDAPQRETEAAPCAKS